MSSMRRCLKLRLGKIAICASLLKQAQYQLSFMKRNVTTVTLSTLI